MHPESKQNLAMHPLPLYQGQGLGTLAGKLLRNVWRRADMVRTVRTVQTVRTAHRSPTTRTVQQADAQGAQCVVLVGSGVAARAFVHALRHDPAASYRLLGYLDGARSPTFEAATGLAWLGGPDDFARVLATNVVDAVFVAGPQAEGGDGAELEQHALACCVEQGVAVHVPLRLPACDPRRVRVAAARGQPMLTLVAAPDHVLYRWVKRALDVGVSASLLVLLAPLLLAVMAAIRLDSPGPAVFVQRRVGLNKRLFPLYKFRTMHRNSEALRAALARLNEADGPVFKIRDDPRVTRLGRFLRRTSIDELPQLVNVLLGHMSLVGPRPLPEADVAGFACDWQRRRFAVRPGITCLWQVSGRSGISFDEWMRLDMHYIDHRCLRLDLAILLRTIPAVMTLAGAY